MNTATTKAANTNTRIARTNAREIAAQLTSVLGFAVYVEADCGDFLITVTDNGCYGPGGAEGDLLLARKVAKAIGDGAAVIACGVVAWDKVTK